MIDVSIVDVHYIILPCLMTDQCEMFTKISALGVLFFFNIIEGKRTTKLLLGDFCDRSQSFKQKKQKLFCDNFETKAWSRLMDGPNCYLN